MSNSKETA